MFIILRLRHSPSHSHSIRVHHLNRWRNCPDCSPVLHVPKKTSTPEASYIAGGSSIPQKFTFPKACKAFCTSSNTIRTLQFQRKIVDLIMALVSGFAPNRKISRAGWPVLFSMQHWFLILQCWLTSPPAIQYSHIVPLWLDCRHSMSDAACFFQSDAQAFPALTCWLIWLFAAVCCSATAV